MVVNIGGTFMYNRNEDIKLAKRKIPNWVISEKLGIHENTFYRWMRTEMSKKRKERVMRAIEEAKEEIKKEGEGKW